MSLQATLEKHAYMRTTAWIEAALGDAQHTEGPFGWRAAMKRDEIEDFAAEACTELTRLGTPRYQVPGAFGGCLREYESLAALARGVARRDPALAVSFGAQIWSQLVWLGGSEAQKG